MNTVEIPKLGAVTVETPAPLRSSTVIPYPTLPPSVLTPTPEITLVRLLPSPEKLVAVTTPDVTNIPPPVTSIPCLAVIRPTESTLVTSS